MGPAPSDSSVRSRRTAILSKRPVPGRVKTRLCPPLSAAEAAALAEGMLRDAVARCTAATGFRTTLAFAPAAEEAWFRNAFPGLDLRPQRGPGLAERLAAVFDELLALPEVATVVAIGSDQPLVDAGRILEAHRRLEAGADLVLGPDLGGGYYLVGLCAPHPELFTEVEMSTPDMRERTLVLARSRGLAVELLERGYDVDVEADLERLRADLAELERRGADGGADFPRCTRDRLGELFPA